MREAKIVVAEVAYGNHPVQELGQELIELLILNRHTFPTPVSTERPIHSHTESVSGGKS